MRKILALLAVAGALPLAAQSFEAGALYTWSTSRSQSVDNGGGSQDIKADTWKAPALRFGYNFVSVGPVEFQGNATYQFSNTQDITVNGSSNSAGATEDYKYWAVGAAVNWNFLVRVGVGLEYRSESLHFHQPNSIYDGSTNYNRPWFRATAGWTIPTPLLKPFIGAEVAVPLTSSSYNANDLAAGNIDAVNKGLAPKAQYGLYAGVRF